MKGDFTRITFRPKKHYRKVKLQQGRVQVDADWNEQVDIQHYHDKNSLNDIIGPSGAPQHLKSSFQIIPSLKGYRIGKGRYYVNGNLVENETETDAASQQDLPLSISGNSPALPDRSGFYLAYLDVWERHITSNNDGEIQEPALGSADTGTRSKIVWQVKLHKIENTSEIDSWSGWKSVGGDVRVNRIEIVENQRDEGLVIFGITLDQTGKAYSLSRIGTDSWQWDLFETRINSEDLKVQKILAAVNRKNLIDAICLASEGTEFFFMKQTSTTDWSLPKPLIPARVTFEVFSLGTRFDRLIEVFVVRMDGKSFHITEDGDDLSFQPQSDLSSDSKRFSQIAVGANGDGRLEVFGIETRDGEVWHIVQPKDPDSKTWDKWIKLSSDSKRFSQIAVGANGDGRLEVFGIETRDGEVWHIVQPKDPDSKTWDKWIKLSSDSKRFSQIAVGANGDGRLEVFGIETRDGEVWHIVQPKDPDSKTWDKWIKLSSDSKEFNQILVRTMDNGRLEVFGIGKLDQQVYHNVQKDSQLVNCNSSIPSWDSTIEPSNATLQARCDPDKGGDGLCTMAVMGGYKGLENQLYRIEIHSPPSPTNPGTFKWSRDNGSIVTKINNISGESISVESNGKDRILGFSPGQWVEIIDDRHELWGIPGSLVKLSHVKEDELIFDSSSVLGELPNNGEFPHHLNPLVRRWDSKGLISLGNNIDSEGYQKIEDGVEIKFNEGSLHTGDYWTIPARTLKGDIEWPMIGSDPIAVRPEGIEHHYCRLAVLQYSDQVINVLDDCRQFFSPLAAAEPLRREIASFDFRKFLTGEPDMIITNGMSFRYLPSIGITNTLDLNPKAEIFKVKPGELTRWYVINPGPRGSVAINLAGVLVGLINYSELGAVQPKDVFQTLLVPPSSGVVIEVTFPHEGVYLGMDHDLGRFLKGGGFAVLATKNSTADDHPTGTAVSLKNIKRNALTLVANDKILDIFPDNVLYPGGIKYSSRVFNERIPGPIISVNSGQNIDLLFRNECKTIQSLVIQGDGGQKSFSGNVTPGDSKSLSYVAHHPGLFLYYGAGDSFNGVVESVASGMYGGILVRPKNERPAKEFYLALSEMYTDRETIFSL